MEMQIPAWLKIAVAVIAIVVVLGVLRNRPIERPGESGPVRVGERATLPVGFLPVT
jgi:hypothetical protein